MPVLDGDLRLHLCRNIALAGRFETSTWTPSGDYFGVVMFDGAAPKHNILDKDYQPSDRLVCWIRKFEVRQELQPITGA